MTELATALDAMARAHGAWVRLHYVYPYPHVDEVIERMTDDPAAGGLLPYLDVPFQHASPRILKLMKRPANAEGTLRRIEAWRARAAGSRHPQHVHRRLPGRDRSASSTSCSRFSKRRELDRVGCFAYSPVDGAAANALPDPVPAEVQGRAPRALHGGAGEDQRATARATGRTRR